MRFALKFQNFAISGVLAGLVSALVGCAERRANEFSGPAEFFQALTNCTTVTIGGRLPPGFLPDSGSSTQLVTLPITLSRRSEIGRFATFLRDARPTFDSELTAKLKRGVKFATSCRGAITVDGRKHIRFMATDLLVFANHQTYLCVTTNSPESYFALDMASLLGEIQRTQSDVNPEQLTVHKYAGLPYMGAYDPPPPTNWASVPEPARTKIIGHLKERFGVEFYNKLSLVGGQIVDFKALREQEPNSKDYQWEVHAYRLHFRLSLPEAGIEFYDAAVEFRSDGSVLEEIDLPETAKHPDRAKFISTSKALQIARDKGFDTAKANVEIGYDPSLGVCVFAFSQMTRQEYPMLYFKRVDINAHTGDVLKIYETEAIQ